MPDQKPPLKTHNDRKYWIFALKIVGDFGITLALPVIILVFLGQRLDQNYQTSILFTVLGFVFAGGISGKIIYKKAKKYGKEYQELDEENQNKKHI